MGEPSKAPSVGSLARGWGFLFEITRRATFIRSRGIREERSTSRARLVKGPVFAFTGRKPRRALRARQLRNQTAPRCDAASPEAHAGDRTALVHAIICRSPIRLRATMRVAEGGCPNRYFAFA